MIFSKAARSAKDLTEYRRLTKKTTAELDPDLIEFQERWRDWAEAEAGHERHSGDGGKQNRTYA
jgi:hypothetical protein